MEAKSQSPIIKAAGLLMFTMILSRILGYLRDVFIYNQFGQNRLTDAYNAAFSIPDFLYMILVGGALSAAFIPVFSSYVAKDNEAEAWRVSSIVLNWVMLLLGIGVAIGCIFTHELIYLLVPGFNPEAMEMTVKLTRIMFFQVFFMSLSGISMGILNSYKHFAAPAIGSVLYNLGIILGGLLLAAPIEARWPGYGIAGFSLGVVIGSALNFFIQIPALIRVGVKYHFSFNLLHPGVRRLLMLMLPVLIGLSVSQINLFVNQNLASTLPEGMVAALRTGQRMMQMPIGVFAIAIAVAVFPTLTSQAAREEKESFNYTASLGIRSVIYITLPFSAALAVLRVPIIRFMFEFQGGKFTPESTQATSDALLFYCLGLFAYGAIHVLSRVFYALQDTKTPVLAGICSLIVNICFSLLLLKPMAQGGLALAYSLAGIINMLLLLILLHKKTGGMDIGVLKQSFIKIILAAAAAAITMGLASFALEGIWGIAGKLRQILQLIIAGGLGAGVYLFITSRCQMEECRQVTAVLKRRFCRK